MGTQRGGNPTLPRPQGIIFLQEHSKEIEGGLSRKERLSLSEEPNSRDLLLASQVSQRLTRLQWRGKSEVRVMQSCGRTRFSKRSTYTGIYILLLVLTSFQPLEQRVIREQSLVKATSGEAKPSRVLCVIESEP